MHTDINVFLQAPEFELRKATNQAIWTVVHVGKTAPKELRIQCHCDHKSKMSHY